MFSGRERDDEDWMRTGLAQRVGLNKKGFCFVA